MILSYLNFHKCTNLIPLRYITFDVNVWLLQEPYGGVQERLFCETTSEIPLRVLQDSRTNPKWSIKVNMR